MRFAKWFAPQERKKAAGRLLDAVVAQARHPLFYTEAGVADTLDGRFDMIAAHLVLVLHRLKGERFKALSQALLDAFFANMDDNLRDMGVGDLSVPKRVKAMSEALYGRIEAYDKPLTREDADALSHALARNVYRREGEVPEVARRLAGYLVAAARALGTQSDGDFEAGLVRFEPPLFAAAAC